MNEADGAPDPIAVAWQRVEASWEDPDAHRAFLTLCVTLGRMPEAGRRYREVRDGDPERREEAQRRIDELLAMATHHLQRSASPPPERRGRQRLLWIAFALSLAMVGLVLWTLVRGI